MVEIRRASTARDALEALDIATQFNDEYYDIPVNPIKGLNWIVRCIEEGIVLLAPDGIIFGAVVEDPVRDWDALVEFGWYAKKSGPALLQEFIQFGKDVGADEVRMTTINTSPRGVPIYLRRKGFKHIESSHRLIL